MKNFVVNLGVLLGVFSSIGVGKGAIAQSITAAEDGTMTIVNQDGDTFTIDGGTLSSDGRNLFHSLEEFGLSPQQIANFLSDPNIQNILTRVTGGNPSTIEGLIQVTGGNSNLFIMNPAGIVFGGGASLNVPADFTATTASSIGFNDGVFQAFGDNNYSSLIGDPSSFNFSDSNGSIVNAGDLSVASGQSLTLLGSTVVNNGSLDAPQGKVIISAVPGTSTVRVTQAGSPLSLEIDVPLDAQGEALPVTVLDLPGLLTGTDADTGLVVDAAGGVQLDETTIPTEAGTTIVSGDVTAAGGDIEIMGTNIGVVSSNLDVTGTEGGRITIGDDIVGSYSAETVYVDAESQISANATGGGNGGTINLTGDRTTRIYGNLSATGGELGGDGGTVTTASGGFLDLTTSPDVSATSGDGGSWLLDAPQVDIVSQTSTPTALTELVPAESKTQINAGLIETALNGGTNVTISTTSSSIQSQANNIRLLDTIDYDATGSNSLSLQAADNIIITPLGGIVDSNPIDTPTDSLDIAIEADTNQNDVGFIFLSGDVFTGGGDLNVLGDNLSVTSTVNSGAGDITFTSDVIDFSSGEIQGEGNLLIQPQTAGLDFLIGGEDSLIDVTEIAVIADGFDSITIGSAQGSGTITVNQNEFQDPVIIQSPSGTINVNGAVTGNDNASVELNSTTINLNDNIVTSSGAITINGNTFLGGDVVLDTTATQAPGASISLNGTVDGNFDLNLKAGEGDVLIDQNLGETTALNSLEVDSTGTTTVNAGTITTDENQVYRGNVVLGSDLSLSSISNDSFSHNRGQNINTQGFNLDISAGEITTGNINTTNNNNAGGSLTVTADTNLTVGDINTNQNSINLSANSGEISTGKINSSGGDVAIATPNNIQIDSIDTSNPGGSAGNVEIDTDQFLVIDETIADTGASINTTGSDSGSVTISHGGNGETAFVVNYQQQQTTAENGTAGTIVTGETEIESGEFIYSYTQKDISILSVDAPTDSEMKPESIDPEMMEKVELPSAADTPITNLDLVEPDTTNTPTDVDSGVSDQALDEQNSSPTSDETTVAQTETQSTNNQRSSISSISIDTEILTIEPGATIVSEPTQPAQSDQTSTSEQSVGSDSNSSSVLSQKLDSIVEAEDSSDSNQISTVEQSSSDQSVGSDSNSSSVLSQKLDSIVEAEDSSDSNQISTVEQSSSEQSVGSDSDSSSVLSQKLDSIVEAEGTSSNRVSTVEQSSSEQSVRSDSNSSSVLSQKLDSIVEADDSITNGSSVESESSSSESNITRDRWVNLEESTAQTSSESSLETNSSNSSTEATTSNSNSVESEQTAVEEENAASGSPTFTNPVNTAFIPNRTQPKTLFQTRETLRMIEQNTAVKPALIYVGFSPNKLSDTQTFAEREAVLTEQFNQYLNDGSRSDEVSIPSSPNDQLELFIVTNKGTAISIRVDVTRQQVLETAAEFYQQVSELGSDYMEPAKQLYQWLVAPIEQELEAQGIENLIYVMPNGLRLVPIAALYDQNSNQYLAQKYNSGLAPSFSLVDTSYRNLQDAPVLAMGASTFKDAEYQMDLPAVGIEVPLIANKIRRGKYYLNKEFTRRNLIEARNRNPYPIIHLATHADFNSGDLQNSYIQLYDSKLRLDDLRALELNDPVVDLLVISACRSAFGDPNAELGFAGLASQIGVKSVIASLWYVGDTGTLALMSEFYRDLETAQIKAEALREAQIALITGEVTRQGDQIVARNSDNSDSSYQIDLPPDVSVNQEDLSHPFYWAAFTLIGSPW